MGKSSKNQKKADPPTKKLGRRKQLQEQERQKEENERKADAALAAGMKKMAERGITEDSDLFAPIPPTDDCAICMAALPLLGTSIGDPASTSWWPCCGQTICRACDIGSCEVLKKINAGREKKKQPALPKSCPFCRTSASKTKDELLGQLLKRIELGDSHAAFSLACKYRDGRIFAKDSRKFFDYLLQAVELGSPEAMNLLGLEYYDCVQSAVGDLVNANQEKRRLCLEASARGGSFCAHRNLGAIERKVGNYDLAVKHYHVAAAAGYKSALDQIMAMHKGGKASKEDFLRAILAYQDGHGEHSTDERKKWEKKMKAEKAKKETEKEKGGAKPKPPTRKKKRGGRGRRR